MGSCQHELHLKPASKPAAADDAGADIADHNAKRHDVSRRNSRSRGINFKTRSLYRQLSNQSQATEPPKPDRQSTKKSPQKSQAQHQRSKSGPGSAPYSFPPGHGRSASASKTSSGPAPFTPTMKPPGAYSRSPRPQRSPGSPRSPGRAGDRSSKIWSNFSKPITFIQNLDSMISQEFEKSLGSDKKSSSKNTSSATSETRAGESTDANPLNRLGFSNSDKNSSFRHLMDSKLNGMSGIYPKESSDDMFQAVSNSLWGFVNDMKTNMASTLVVEPPSSTEDDTTHGHNKPQPRENRHGSVSSLTGGSTRSKDTVPSFQLAVPQEAHIKETGELESSVDLLDFNDDEDEVLDLTMYSAMRTKQD
ncbi:hypothetical protein JCM33374_g4858 [Metschnikowia sp. JCM 33374]|nr:hypothetical protein JCM33374_g4858 [Metschnikowia sp. JCM 33374]